MGRRSKDVPEYALSKGVKLNGKYLIGDVLGYGGFGITYSGSRLGNGQKVVIKEYLPDKYAGRAHGETEVIIKNPEQFQNSMWRFENEAKLIYNCNNEHVLKIYDLFKENNTAYYVMEYIEGGDLKRFVENHGGTVSWEEISICMLQIMDALITVHRSGYIHRDVSPDNIFVGTHGHAKLIDFGSARLPVNGGKLTVILKKRYAPPEQYLVDGNQGPWTDIYSLAATIYWCLSGSTPPPAPDRQRNDTIKSLRSIGARVPDNVDAAVMKALNLDIRDRFRNVLDFRNAVLNGDPTVSVRYSGFGKVFKPFKKKESLVIDCLNGVFKGQSFTISDDVIIGRDEQVCNMIYPQGTRGVSRIHCQFLLNQFGTHASIVDCDSSYGTFVNGRRIQPGRPVELRSGDRIEFGEDNVFEVRW